MIIIIYRCFFFKWSTHFLIYKMTENSEKHLSKSRVQGDVSQILATRQYLAFLLDFNPSVNWLTISATSTTANKWDTSAPQLTFRKSEINTSYQQNVDSGICWLHQATIAGNCLFKQRVELLPSCVCSNMKLWFNRFQEYTSWRAHNYQSRKEKTELTGTWGGGCPSPAENDSGWS